MNTKQFEYLNKDVPFLKKDSIKRMVFSLIYFAIFIWQFMSVVSKSINGEKFNTGMIISSIFVLLVSFMFAGISLLYCFKSIKILDVIKKEGRCVSSVAILFNTSKKGFVSLYSFITEVLAIICSIVLLCSIIYGLLEFSYLSSVSFYMPVLAVLCCCGFYSSYHIKAEIITVKNVQSFNSIY